MKIHDYPIIVVVFGQEGCPACEEFIPRFRQVAARYQACIPSIVVDAGRYVRAADHYRIQETPTTCILRYGWRSPVDLRGAQPTRMIESLFQGAMVGADCQLRR